MLIFSTYLHPLPKSIVNPATPFANSITLNLQSSVDTPSAYSGAPPLILSIYGGFHMHLRKQKVVILVWRGLLVRCFIVIMVLLKMNIRVMLGLIESELGGETNIQARRQTIFA